MTMVALPKLGRRLTAIAVSQYEEESQLQPLPVATADVEAISRCLLDRWQHPEGEPPPIKLRKVIDPDLETIRQNIQDLFSSNSDEEEFRLLYFSGYAIPTASGEIYLATKNTNKNQLHTTALPLAFLSQCMAESGPMTVAILDCCWAATAPEASSIPTPAVGAILSYFGLAAEKQRPFSPPGDDELQSSPYTHYLIEGITTGIADADLDGIISLNEWHAYASQKIQIQTPGRLPVILGWVEALSPTPESVRVEALSPTSESSRVEALSPTPESSISNGINVGPVSITTSPTHNPQLQYRRAVENFARRRQGDISAIAQRILDIRRQRLGLSTPEAESIRQSVLAPYLTYKAKLQQYDRVLSEAVSQEGLPLSSSTREDLKYLQITVLGLTDADIAPIETQRLNAQNLRRPFHSPKKTPPGLGSPPEQSNTPPSPDAKNAAPASIPPRSSSAAQWEQRLFLFLMGSGLLVSATLAASIYLLIQYISAPNQPPEALALLDQFLSSLHLEPLDFPVWFQGKGDEETGRPGNQGTRKPGDQGTRGQRNQGTREPGDKETRGPGNGGTRGPGVSPSPSHPVTPSPRPPISLSATLTGHNGPVQAAIFSPDGATIYSSSDDGAVKAWKTTSPDTPIASFAAGATPVRALALVPDGKTLISGRDDGKLQIWDVAETLTNPTPQPTQEIAAHIGPIYALVVLPDKTVVSASGDTTIKIWPGGSDPKPQELTGHSGPVRALAISPDGQTLVSASSDRTIKIWNPKTGEERATLTSHTGVVRALAISPDSQTLVSGSWDKTIKIWNLSTGEELATLTGHTDKVTALAISPDGSTLFSGSDDNTIKVWNLGSGEELATLTDHTSDVFSLALSPDGKTLASASWDKTLKLWR
ncbi:WD40 repeat domain-containing protein [[Phormidium] sp. ETS-05]|uniref:WD40 repeat domain-containing protein n=1 Tax=[Phormidium] sp. ETS-05 TaxID=222819 RepID=UPI0018EF05CF|nr:WD40 repeat domain-containing protein [[Phormidium] sp. ETS-05]